MNIGSTIKSYRKKLGLRKNRLRLLLVYLNQQFQNGKVVMLILI